jgi:APA family basic amino acid/polyamine antiporter
VAAIALSACCVLVYYAITNAAALRLPSAGRRWPRWTAYLGVAGCAVLAVSLPWQRVLTTAAVLVAGTALTGWHSRSRP